MTPELRGSKYEVKQMSKYLCTQSYVDYQGRIQQWHIYTFSHPRLMNATFELNIPQSFPREQPWLYIRPQEGKSVFIRALLSYIGHRIVHTLNYANADGLVTFPQLMEKSINVGAAECLSSCVVQII